MQSNFLVGSLGSLLTRENDTTHEKVDNLAQLLVVVEYKWIEELLKDGLDTRKEQRTKDSCRNERD